MSTNITNRYLNPDKREAEVVVVTVPAILQEGGGRTNADPVYLQGGEDVSAQVIEADTLIKKIYLDIQEAFPASALLNVNIAGTDYFVGVDGTTTGLNVSTTEDVLLANKQTVVVSVAGVTGDIMTGKARVIIDAVHGTIKNGRYAN